MSAIVTEMEAVEASGNVVSSLLSSILTVVLEDKDGDPVLRELVRLTSRAMDKHMLRVDDALLRSRRIDAFMDAVLSCKNVSGGVGEAAGAARGNDSDDKFWLRRRNEDTGTNGVFGPYDTYEEAKLTAESQTATGDQRSWTINQKAPTKLINKAADPPAPKAPPPPAPPLRPAQVATPGNPSADDATDGDLILVSDPEDAVGDIGVRQQARRARNKATVAPASIVDPISGGAITL